MNLESLLNQSYSNLNFSFKSLEEFITEVWIDFKRIQEEMVMVEEGVRS
jgi:hypothetical protein